MFIGDPKFATRRGTRCRCEWCGEWIETGSQYVSYGQHWEGEFQHMRMHDECYRGGYQELDWDYYEDGFPTREMHRGAPQSKDEPLPSQDSG